MSTSTQKNKKVTFILLSCFLCLTNIFFIRQFFAQKKNFNEIESILKKQWNVQPIEADIYEDIFKMLQMDRTNINPEIVLFDEFKKKYTLKDKTEGKTLIMHYSQLNCNVCVDSALTSFLKYASKIDYKNTLILASYVNWADYYTFKRLNSMKIPVYMIDSLGSPLEEFNIPYFFILNEDFTVSHTFIPHKEALHYTDSYLKLMEYLFNYQ